MNISSRLKKVQKELGMNNAQLGKKVGMSREQISRIHLQKHNTNLGTLEKIAKKLNLAPVAIYKSGKLEDLGLKSFGNGREINNYIGRVLQKYRSLNMLNKKDISDKNGFSSPIYSEYEQGLKKPSLKRLEKICKYFKLEPTYLQKKPLPKRK